MEGYKHFSHPHTLTFHQSLEDAQLTCTGCNFPCFDTPVYACHACKFFLHDQCFEATRSLIHPSHPDHPLLLFSSPTYTSGSFICSSCNEIGSGFGFGCPTCEFDLHIHCAYNTLNPNPSPYQPPNQIKLKSHPNHLLKYYTRIPRSAIAYVIGKYICNVCGTDCDPNGALYRCDICDYDTHVGCTRLPETFRRADHAHTLSLLYLNPNPEFVCDVCGDVIPQNNCMYFCTSCCGYGVHVKCVSDAVSKTHLMSKLYNKTLELIQNYWVIAFIILIFAILMVNIIKTRGYYHYPVIRPYNVLNCDANSCRYSTLQCDANGCRYNLLYCDAEGCILNP